jgi:hypothetical protein
MKKEKEEEEARGGMRDLYAKTKLASHLFSSIIVLSRARE